MKPQKIIYEPDDFFTAFTVPDIAKKFKIEVRTVRRWIAQKQLKAKKIGRTYFITKAAIKEFIGSEDR